MPERAEKIYAGSCMKYRKIGRQGCTLYCIYEQDLHDAVLKDIQEWAKLEPKDEKAVPDKVMEHENRNRADIGAAIEKKFSLEKRLVRSRKTLLNSMRIMLWARRGRTRLICSYQSTEKSRGS